MTTAEIHGPHNRNHRNTPIDRLMREIERDYAAGRIGITATGEIIPLLDIYEDLQRDTPPTDYHVAPARMIDRDYQHTCPHCGTAYRDQDQRDPDRCPFCWRLI